MSDLQWTCVWEVLHFQSSRRVNLKQSVISGVTLNKTRFFFRSTLSLPLNEKTLSNFIPILVRTTFKELLEKKISSGHERVPQALWSSSGLFLPGDCFRLLQTFFFPFRLLLSTLYCYLLSSLQQKALALSSQGKIVDLWRECSQMQIKTTLRYHLKHWSDCTVNRQW